MSFFVGHVMIFVLLSMLRDLEPVIALDVGEMEWKGIDISADII